MRVIQDSEDEDDFDLDQVPNGRDASRVADASPQLEEHGTGSTDSLKRCIEDAHRLHFESPSGPSPGVQDAPRSSVSLPEHANKRRKTTFDASAAESPKPNSSNNKRASTIPTEPAAEKPWELRGTVQEQWQYHEPEMFVNPPSSTVPNATATQQRLLGEAIAPPFLGIDPDPDAPRYEPAKSSIPWSDYLKSTPEQTRSTNQSATLLDQHDGAMPQNRSDGGLVLETSLLITSASQSSQRSRRESTSQQKGSPLRNELHRSTIYSTGTILPPTLSMGKTLFDENLSGNPMTSIKGQRLSDSPQKSPCRNRKSQERVLTKAQLGPCLVPSSEDDLMSIGLPKENYNPRPSRSRSLKLASSEPVDYSIRPEKAAQKPRRTRTSGAENGCANTTPEKIRSICDMGFAPLITQRALKQNNGDVASSVDWLIANGISDEDELAPPKTSVSKKKKKKVEMPTEKHETPPSTKGPSHRDCTRIDNQERTDSRNTADKVENTPVVDDDMTGPDILLAPTLSNPPKSPRVSVVIPKKAQTSPSKDDSSHRLPEMSPPKRDLADASKSQAKRTKMSIKQSESILEEFVTVEASATSAPEPREEKKKRGRPKREAKSSVIVLKTQEDRNLSDSTGTIAVLEEMQATGPTVVENVATGREERVKKTEEPVPTLSVSNNKTVSKTKTSREASETPEKFLKADKSTEANPGAQSKVKTPYRVGLSKRARIAPLLRIVKK